MSVTVRTDPAYPDADHWPKANSIQVGAAGALLVGQLSIIGPAEPTVLAAYAPAAWWFAALDEPAR